MRTLYFDCFSGISGDMTVGALLDLGLDFNYLKAELAKLHVDSYELRMSRTVRANLSAVKFDVIVNTAHGSTLEHSHDHHHHQHHDHGHSHDTHDHEHAHPHPHEHSDSEAPWNTVDHHHWKAADILKMIRESKLTPGARAIADRIFTKLAIAEGRVHNMPPEDVMFHEVGAVDSIVDVCGAAIGLDALGVEHSVCSAINVGGGFIHCQHGIYPVPAPATANLLVGATIYSRHVERELVTPTGAAILAAVVDRFEPVTGFVPERIGYGAGTKQFGNFPNCLRLMLGEDRNVATAQPAALPVDAESNAITVIEANLDDAAPSLLAFAAERLLEEGALDVVTIPVQMKKGRPGHLLQVLAPSNRVPELTTVLYRETTTIGVRSYRAERDVLERAFESVETGHGSVRVKVARRSGEIFQATPEFEDCARVARASGVPLKDIQTLAMRAFGERHSAD